jgi:NADPH-dependent curcumin reductase CurA
LARLCALVQSGQLAVALDSQQFKGLGAVPSAVQRLQSGASSGKVVVQLADSLPAVEAAKL